MLFYIYPIVPYPLALCAQFCQIICMLSKMLQKCKRSIKTQFHLAMISFLVIRCLFSYQWVGGIFQGLFLKIWKLSSSEKEKTNFKILKFRWLILSEAIKYSASPKKKTIGDLMYKHTNMRRRINRDSAIFAKLLAPFIIPLLGGALLSWFL